MFEFFFRERHDRQSWVAYQPYLSERGVAFDGRERNGVLEARQRPQVNRRPVAAFGGGVGLMFAYHFGYAHYLETFVAVVV